MFDLRYHVASLTAVFVALVVGILVGVGLSGKGFVNDAERANLTREIDQLRQERNSAQQLLGSAGQSQQALDDYANATYPVVVPGRLKGKKVAVLFVGPIDRRTAASVGRAVHDAGGSVLRTRSLGVPIDPKAIQDKLELQVALRRLAGPADIEAVGRSLAVELVSGGKTPLWDALGELIVLERAGPGGLPADGVVVVRSAGPQSGITKAFLSGMYTGLARAGAVAVGTERVGTSPSAIPAFALAGLSTVDSVDTAAGRLGLVLLLSGAEPGSYGSGDAAKDGILPAIPPAPSQG